MNERIKKSKVVRGGGRKRAELSWIEGDREGGTGIPGGRCHRAVVRLGGSAPTAEATATASGRCAVLHLHRRAPFFFQFPLDQKKEKKEQFSSIDD